MMTEPPIGAVVAKTQSRFGLVVLSARRARQINAYFNQLGEGLGGYVPPQVHSLSRKPLSIADPCARGSGRQRRAHGQP